MIRTMYCRRVIEYYWRLPGRAVCNVSIVFVEIIGEKKNKNVECANSSKMQIVLFFFNGIQTVWQKINITKKVSKQYNVSVFPTEKFYAHFHCTGRDRYRRNQSRVQLEEGGQQSPSLLGTIEKYLVTLKQSEMIYNSYYNILLEITQKHILY